MAGFRPSTRMPHWTLLLVMALVMRAFVPQGMMVQETEIGGIEIAICNSDQVWTIPVKSKAASNDHSGPNDQMDGSGQHCLFAGHGSGGLPPAVPLADLLPQLADAPYDGIREFALAPDTVRLSPPARAPPVSV